MKKILIISLMILTITGCGCNKKEKNNNVKQDDIVSGNTNNGITDDKVLDEFTFTQTSLVIDNGNSVLTTTVTNNSEEDKNTNTFKIIVKDEKGNIIKENIGYIGGIIKSKDSKVIVTNFNIDLTDAYNIEYLYNN